MLSEEQSKKETRWAGANDEYLGERAVLSHSTGGVVMVVQAGCSRCKTSMFTRGSLYYDVWSILDLGHVLATAPTELLWCIQQSR